MAQLVRALLSSAVGFLIPAGLVILVPNHDQQHAAAHYMPPKMPAALWLQQGREQLRGEEEHLHYARASYEENFEEERARVLAERLEKIQQEEQSVALRCGRESDHFYAVVRDKSAWLSLKHLQDLAIGKQQRRESGLYVNASPALAAWESAEKERQEQDFRDLATQRQAAASSSTSTQRTPTRARTPRATQTARQETLGDSSSSSPRTSSKPSRICTRRTSTQKPQNDCTASAGQLEQDLDARGSSSTSSIIPRGGCPLPTLQTQLRQSLLENYAEAEGEAIFMHGYLSREHEFIQQKNDRELQERHRRELDGGAHDPHQNSSPCSPSSKQTWQKQERRMQADDWRRLEQLRDQEVPLRMQQRKDQRAAIGQSVLTDLRMVLLGELGGDVENQDLHLFWDEKVKRAEAAAIGFLRSFEDVGEGEIALVRDLLHALRRVAAGVITRSTPPPLLMKNVGSDGAQGTSAGSVLFQIAVNDEVTPAGDALERLQKQDREKLEEEFLHPSRRFQYRRSICEWDEDLPTPTTASRHQPAGFVSSNSIEEAAAAKRTSVKWHPLGQMWRELAAEIEAAEVANLKDLLREVEMVNNRGRAAARQLTAEDFARMSELCRRHIVSAADVGEGVAGFLGVAAEEESDTPVGPPTIDELEIDMDREAGEHLQLLSADVNTEDLQEEPDVTARDVDWPLPGGHFSPEQVVDQEERPLLPAFFRSRQELEEAESRRRRETMESGARQAISELCPPRTFAFSLSGCGAGVSAERKEEVVRVLQRRHERDLEAGRQLRLASGWYGVEEVEQWALGEQEWQREFLQAVLAGGASARASRRIISHI